MINHRKLLFLIAFICISVSAFTQGITVYQYRQIPYEQMEEFIERETKYWSEVAEKAIDEGKLEFWALLVKEGVFDVQNASNVLFINTYSDIDNRAGIWDAKSVFPDVPMEDMQTGNMGKTTSMIYLKNEMWIEASHANQEEDFNYVKMSYHNSKYPYRFLNLENEKWSPFIQTAMNNKQTSQVAWGNAMILDPKSIGMKANTVSFDLYPNLKEALLPTWSEDIKYPMDLFQQLDSIRINRTSTQVYRIVKAVSKKE